MEQIPAEVLEKIENYINENIGIVFSDSDQDLKDANKIARSETKEALEYGYRLASHCALCEGKDEMIKKLKDNILILQINCANYESKANELNDENIELHEHNLTLADRNISLEKKGEGKEKEIAELKEQYAIMDGRRERAIKSLEESEKQFEQLQEAYNKLIGG